jgi:diguanylate cyclase (GGDEF)-like protein/PAS domain S-box-containing protein
VPDVSTREVVPVGRELRARVPPATRADGPRSGRLVGGATYDDWEDGRLLLDHISDAIYATDIVNRITKWTTSAERLFGYSASEAIGRSLSELFPSRIGEPGGERELLTTLEAGRTWRGEGSVRLRDGREIWLGSAVEPIMADGRLAGSVWVSRDITAIHEKQRKLVDEERFVETILDVVGALVLVLDRQGRVVRFNTACERLSGYRQEEVVGRAIWDMVIPPDEVEDVQTTMADLQAGAFPNSHENHWLTRTGGPRLISWENTCLVDDHGVVTHVIATGTDITEARRRHDAMRGLETIGRLLGEQGPGPAALAAVLDEMQTRMGYRFLSLYLSEAPGLRLAAQRGYPMMPEFLDTATGVVGRVYRAGRAELVPDVKSDLDYVPDDEGVASEIAVPLLGDAAPLGVLNIEAEEPKLLTESDLQFARTVADRLASALRRSQTQEALLDRMRLLTALSEFAVAVNAIRDPKLLVVALVDAVSAVVPADTVVITMLDPRDGQYRVSAARGLAQGAVGATIEPGVGTAGRAISERAAIFTDSHSRAQSTPSLQDYMADASIRSVGVPLIREDVVVGVITVGRAEADATFTQAECEVFALLGSHAALALANANLVAEVSALAIHDGLTGLYNRRHFDAALDLAIARFKRHAPAGSLAAIMFDLDHFGEFNRRHGHLAGDTLLREFGEILRNRLRSADIVARYGGEEFIAILEDCGLPEASRLAEEVRKELEGRSVKGADGRSVRATVSAGCAVMHTADPTKDALLGRADIALYMAKEAGRNRVVAT